MLTLAEGRSGVQYVTFPFIARGTVKYSIDRRAPETFMMQRPPTELVDSAKGGSGFASAEISSLLDANGVLLRQVGIMRGLKVYTLIVSPYKYDAATGRVSFYKTININLTSSLPFPDDHEDPLGGVNRIKNNVMKSAAAIPTGSSIRIVVNKEGIYRVTGYELDTAGIKLGAFTGGNMTLWNHGKQIPIYVRTTGGTAFTKDSYFEFFGTPNRVEYSEGRQDMYRDPFTDENVYILTSDSTASAQRLVTESGAVGRAGDAVDLSNYSFTQTAHLEQDEKYEHLDMVDIDRTFDRTDHWFWTGVSSQQIVILPFYIAYPDTTSIQALTLNAAFQGITHFDGGPQGSLDIPDEHQAELFINNSHVLSATWDSQRMKIADVGARANIPQSILSHGTNNFKVYNASSGNVAVTSFDFNWVELHYQRLYVADKDYIRFTVPDNAQPGDYSFYIRNFQNSSISVYRMNTSKISDATIFSAIETRRAPRYAVRFEARVQSTNDQFIAVSDSAKLSPVRIEQVTSAGLSSHDYSTDYIIIAGRQLYDVSAGQTDVSNPVARLASWYNEHGVRTLVVNPEQIFDDFNFGIKSPYALRSFISYAYHNWSTAPKYVLLVGQGTNGTKATYNVKDYVPAMAVQTYNYGAASSDNFYACVDGDDPIPDVAVGRIPAVNIEQVGAVVDKILSYIGGAEYGWQNTALLIAGEENSFHEQTDLIAHSVIPSRYFITRLYTSIKDPDVDTKYYGTTDNLSNYLNQGVVFTNYMGHGGSAIWSDNGLLTNEEVDRLSNSGKYPFVASLTCFTGAFGGESGRPLACTLLFAEKKGAIGLLASSGLGWMQNDFYLGSELAAATFDTASMNSSIGSDILLAKADYYASYSNWPQAPSMLNQYNLLGDPAVVLQLPRDSCKVKLNSYSAVAGRDISGQISNAPAGGKGTIQLTDSDGYVISQANVSVGGDGTANFSIPYSGGLSGLSHVKVYAFNNSSQSSAVVDLTTAGNFIQVYDFRVSFEGNSLGLRISGSVSSASPVTSVVFDGKVYAAGMQNGNQPLFTLNIPLSVSGQNEYEANYLIGGDSLQPGQTITGYLIAHTSDGGSDSSQFVSYTVPGAADVSAYSRQSYANYNSSMKVVADSVIRLEANVYDWNSVPVKDVRIDFFDGIRSNGVFLGEARISFDTASTELVSVPVSLSPGNHTVYMYAAFDSLTEGYDLNPSNNYACASLNVKYVLADQQGRVAIDSAAVLYGAVAGTIFTVDTTTPPLYTQPLMNIARDRNGKTRFCEFVPQNKALNGEYTLSLEIIDPDSVTNVSLTGLHLYRYDPRTRTLNLVGGNYNNGYVSGTVNDLGIFTAAQSTDHTAPQISFSVGDQFFSSGDFVPPNPRFSVLINDEEGVNLQKGSTKVQVDNRPIESSLLTIPDTVSNPTSVAVTLQFPLEDGSHNIRITAEDANGNISSPVEADFVVRSDFSLRVFGAYPNPFVNQTFIAFEVTSGSMIETVEIKIYSVSGRLVRTIRYPSNSPAETLGLFQGGTGSPTAVGYHEAWWDGTDNFGNQVANGVYFYKVSVTAAGKTLVETGKLARLR